MWNWLPSSFSWTAEQRANGLASCLAFGALGLLYIEAPPIPAGATIQRATPNRSRAVVLATPSAQPQASVLPNPTTPLLQFASAQPVATTAMASAGTASDLEPLPSGSMMDNQAPAAIQTLQKKVAILEQGRHFLQNCPDYTAVFSKQELVGGELLEMQDIFLKCRHQPFSVYLQWLSGDEGREVLYVNGENDGRMIVHGGGWKARLPALTISPDSSLAMAECRYPVTKAGLLGTIDLTLTVHAEDLAKQRIANCQQLDDQEFDGRMCTTFVTEYRDAASSPTYRKSITLIDKEWNIPLYMRNFGWPESGETAQGEELDEATLIEYYTFTEIEFRQNLASKDFDRTNEEYLFK